MSDQTRSEWKRWHKITLGVIGGLFVLVVVAGITGEEEENGRSTRDSQREPTKERPFRISPASVRQLVEDEVDGEPKPEVECSTREYCKVSYEIEEQLGLFPEAELLDEQRGVWEGLFIDPKLESGFIQLRGAITTAGGKEDIAPVLSVYCERKAARQIDWDAVEPEGLKTLCEWTEHVEL